MKKFLIPALLGVTILSTSVAIVALGNPSANTRYPNSAYRDENVVGNYRGGMMGGFAYNQAYRGGMMGGYGYQTTISTDLSGSAYDQTSLKAALDTVLADEYKARAEYEAIVDTFGAQNPYVQLINAETNHINALSRVYTAFGWTIPSDNGAASAVVPTSLDNAYQIGIDAETSNIALYQTYLNTDLPTSIQRIFANLQRASENHLSVFTAYKNGDTTGFINGCPMFDND